MSNIVMNQTMNDGSSSNNDNNNTTTTVISNRTKPNILITGTPGTGKTSTSKLIAEMTGMKHIN